MGIQGFSKVIKKICPNVQYIYKLTNLFGWKVAVDVSIYLNKYVKSMGAERWIDGFILLISALKRHGIKCIFIFDGPNLPPEKTAERERRRSQVEKTKVRIDQGTELIKEIQAIIRKNANIPENVKRDAKTVLGPIRDKKTNVNYSDPHDLMAVLSDALTTMKRQILPILPEYSKMAKEFIDSVGLVWYQADGEAEKLCASLCVSGLVDAVFSEDTDVLAYGTPIFLSEIDIRNETCKVSVYSEILQGLELKSESFLDLCILLSCDYNDRIKAFIPNKSGKPSLKAKSIGEARAYDLICEYESIEELEPIIEDVEPLIYRRCRELFTPIPLSELPCTKIPCNRPINKLLLSKFCEKYNITDSIRDHIIEMFQFKHAKFAYID